MESGIGHDDGLLGLLASIKDTFWREHRRQGVPDAEIRQLWGQQYVDRLAPVLSIDTPSSIQSHLSETYGENDASISAQAIIRPQSQSMLRSRTKAIKSCSALAETSNTVKSRKRANSLAITSSDAITRPARLLATSADQDPEITFSGRKMQRTASGSRMLPAVSEGLIFEDPAEYLDKAGIGSYQIPHLDSGLYSSLPIGLPASVYEPPTLASSLSCSLNQSLPLTPDPDTMQNDAFFTLPMSRQDSLGVDFRSGFAMFRLDSQISNSSDRAVLPQTSFTSQVNEAPSRDVPSPQPERSLEFTSQRSQAACEPVISSYSAQILASHTRKQLYDSSTDHIKSVSRRKSGHDSQVQNVERVLKPKVQHTDGLSASLGSYPVIKGDSETGVADKCPISKTPYNRPSKQKIRCPYCDKQPEGFRGDHELRRHQKLHHSNIRIGWICVDISPERNLLSGCKHCRSQKVYGAYYNAAAHLRRVHFHPRKEGRKARGCVSRAGKGGGDDPPMEELKRWMKQVEVTENSTRTIQVSDDGELSSGDQEQPTFDAFYQIPNNISFGTDYLPVDDVNNVTSYATNFPLASSGFPWPSDDAWSAFRQSSAFDEADIFGLELQCEV